MSAVDRLPGRRGSPLLRLRVVAQPEMAHGPLSNGRIVNLEVIKGEKRVALLLALAKRDIILLDE